MIFQIVDFGTVEKEARKLTHMAQLALETLPVTEEISLDMFRIEREIFASGGRRGGGSWAQLKADTVRKKGTTEILRTSGANEGYSVLGPDALYTSVTEPGAEYQVLEVGNTEIAFGTSHPFGAEHQYGNARVPARPFVNFTYRDTTRWADMLYAHLMKAFV